MGQVLLSKEATMLTPVSLVCEDCSTERKLREARKKLARYRKDHGGHRLVQVKGVTKVTQG